MKRVVFFVSPAVGGAERVTITIAKLLDPNKYDVTIIIVGKEKGEIVDFVPPHMHIKLIKIKNIWDFVTLRMWLQLRKIKPDFVFCSAIYLNPRVVLASKITGGVKIILRNNIGIHAVRTDLFFLVRCLYSFADFIILQTEEMKHEMETYFPKLDRQKLGVITNPIDTELVDSSVKGSISPFDKEYLNYVFVGRIDYTKGLDILIPAFAKLIRNNPKCRLYIIGKINESTTYYQSLINSIKELGISNNVIWVGFTKNPYVYEKFADCFVLPSRIEGLPNVLLDAMYLNTPVVVSRSVPIIDRIVSMERGIVVDVNDIDELSSAMARAVNLQIPQNKYICNNMSFRNLFN